MISKRYVFPIIVSCFVLITSCSDNTAPPKVSQESMVENYNTADKIMVESTGTITDEPNPIDTKGKRKLLYQYSNDTLTQVLNVEWIKDNTIRFTLLSENKGKKCKVEISGVAKHQNSGADPEIDEDEEGIAYPSIEYVSEESDCEVIIRIAMDDRDKAIVQMVDCPAKQKDSCPLESVGILIVQE